MRVCGACVLALCAVTSLMAAGDTRLVDAVRVGDGEAVRVLLAGRADVNVPDVDGTRPLHWAAHLNDLETVRLLLRSGADANVANRYGVSPLALAATGGHAAVARALLDAGADANAALPEGETVLMTAARTGNPVVVEQLLAHGADPNAREEWLGETALMWAAGENHAEAARVLIKGGAKLDARSAPSTLGDWVLKPPVLGFITVEFPKGAWTPLMYAARQGSLDAARVLVDAGAPLNSTGPDGLTALVLAIVNAHYELAALLVDHGADPNLADTAGMAALYAAVDMHTLPWMLARPDFKPTGALTALDIVRRLLEHGAKPDTRLKTPFLQREHMEGDPALGEGATPFMRAAKAGDVAAMRVLLEHGANPSLVLKNQSTALMLAAGLGWRDGGNGTPRGDRGTEPGAIDAIALCLERGADIGAVNDRGETALHAAVAGRASEAIVRYLVERGARLDATDKQGRTPLDALLVSRRERPGLVALLRALGAPPSSASTPVTAAR